MAKCTISFFQNMKNLPMNLFLSSFAMRAARARPIPEEHPVMRTTFWLIVPAQCLSRRSRERKEGNKRCVFVEVDRRRGGTFIARSLIHRSATQQKPCAHGLQITNPAWPTHGAAAWWGFRLMITSLLSQWIVRFAKYVQPDETIFKKGHFY